MLCVYACSRRNGLPLQICDSFPRPPCCVLGWVQGLIPRASELIKLGVAFGFAFIPFALAVALAFGGLYSVSAMAWQGRLNGAQETNACTCRSMRGVGW